MKIVKNGVTIFPEKNTYEVQFTRGGISYKTPVIMKKYVNLGHGIRYITSHLLIARCSEVFNLSILPTVSQCS